MPVMSGRVFASRGGRKMLAVGFASYPGAVSRPIAFSRGGADTRWRLQFVGAAGDQFVGCDTTAQGTYLATIANATVGAPDLARTTDRGKTWTTFSNPTGLRAGGGKIVTLPGGNAFYGAVANIIGLEHGAYTSQGRALVGGMITDSRITVQTYPALFEPGNHCMFSDLYYQTPGVGKVAFAPAAENPLGGDMLVGVRACHPDYYVDFACVISGELSPAQYSAILSADEPQIGLFYSTDGGANWVLLYDVENVGGTDAAFAGDRWLAYIDGQLKYSSNLLAWTATAAQLGGEPTRIVGHPQNRAWIAASRSTNVIISKNKMTTATSSSPSLGGTATALCWSGNHLYAARSSTTGATPLVRHTANFGATWNTENFPAVTPTPTSVSIQDICSE